ncbi:hypothetical protein Tco_0071551 [Tanacetum coccineum]
MTDCELVQQHATAVSGPTAGGGRNIVHPLTMTPKEILHRKINFSRPHHQCALQKKPMGNGYCNCITGEESKEGKDKLMERRQEERRLETRADTHLFDWRPESKKVRLTPGHDVYYWLHGRKDLAPRGQIRYRLWLDRGATPNALDDFNGDQITIASYNGIIGTDLRNYQRYAAGEHQVENPDKDTSPVRAEKRGPSLQSALRPFLEEYKIVEAGYHAEKKVYYHDWSLQNPRVMVKKSDDG